MALGSRLLSTLLLALLVAANPIVVRDNKISLPLVKRTNFVNGTVNLLQRDQARAAHLKARAAAKRSGIPAREVGSVSATNQAEDYIVSVGVGSPATYCKRVRV